MANAAGIFHRYLMILQYIPRYPASNASRPFHWSLDRHYQLVIVGEGVSHVKPFEPK